MDCYYGAIDLPSGSSVAISTSYICSTSQLFLSVVVLYESIVIILSETDYSIEY